PAAVLLAELLREAEDAALAEVALEGLGMGATLNLDLGRDRFAARVTDRDLQPVVQRRRVPVGAAQGAAAAARARFFFFAEPRFFEDFFFELASDFFDFVGFFFEQGFAGFGKG